MSAIEILGLCSAVYLVVIIVDAIRTRQFKRLLWHILIWVVAIVIALLYFQQTTGRIAFGDGPSRIVAISVTFVATLVGIAAHYFFNLEKRADFDWFTLFKPLLITPIVILPLVGSMQQNANIEMMQLVMLGLLAFQNGFFWRAVFEKAQAHAGT